MMKKWQRNTTSDEEPSGKRATRETLEGNGKVKMALSAVESHKLAVR